MSLSRSLAVSKLIGRVIPQESFLFVCDIQERFRSLIYEMPTVIETARALEVPCVATEQNPRVLLESVVELNLKATESHEAVPVFAKQKFSMWTQPVVKHLNDIYMKDLTAHRDTDETRLPPAARNTVILCGIESHVCVLQTCLDLIDNGYQVHVVVDGCSSQKPYDRAVSFSRMKQAGAFLTTAESIVFQMMQTANHPSFRAVSSMVKSHAKSPHRAFAEITQF